MEYERIHKVQTGMISPSKLRMKLLGAHNQKKKDESKSNSSRTSPSRHEDSEFVKNSLLLTSPDEDFNIQDSSVEVVPEKSDSAASDSTLSQHNDHNNLRTQHGSKTDSSDSSSVHPARGCEDENLDYDSTSSFEFHKGERSLHHPMNRTFSRPMPSKWNDAEKWIMNRQSGQMNVSKKGYMQNQINRPNVPNSVRVAPEFTSSDSNTWVKKVDFVQPIGAAKSGFFHGVSPVLDHQQLSLFIETKDVTEVDDEDTKSVTEENKDVPMVRSVSMRDMGTEMTLIPSQEPSRSVTPLSSTTPLRSPTSSVPSTPRQGEPMTTPTELYLNNATHNGTEAGKKEPLLDHELKLKTRREIVALGVQLGKMNIAAWASKDEKDKNENRAEVNEFEFAEYAKRAAAWEEAEKTKHAARFKREEIRIQAWESRQKAKLEAEMKKIEAQIEQMKAQAQAKMVKKVALARHKSEEKRTVAEANKNRLAEKTAAQAEYIRQTGRLPTSPFMCCGW